MIEHGQDDEIHDCNSTLFVISSWLSVNLSFFLTFFRCLFVSSYGTKGHRPRNKITTKKKARKNLLRLGKSIWGFEELALQA